MNKRISSELKNWIPYRLVEEAGISYCKWLYLGHESIEEPFFEETINKCIQLPENSHLLKGVSSLEILPEWAQSVETVPPTAIIFHISRCGSTLISQLLSLNPENIVLSEVPFFDELLRNGHKKNNGDSSLLLLKAAIDFYGAKRADQPVRMIIKTDSWHIHFYKQFRQMYPQTPFIFLYRRPDEVMRSQQKRRGMQSVPGLIDAEIFGFDANDFEYEGLDDYMAKVIESYLHAFSDILHKDPLCMAANYQEGALSIIKRIAAFCGWSMQENEWAAMEQRLNYHGKYPTQVFTEERMTDPPAEYLKKAFEWYEAVEKIRKGNK